MIDWTQLRKGNLIHFDHNEHRQPAYPILRGIVERADQHNITMTGGCIRKPDRCAGIPLDKFWFDAFCPAADLHLVQDLKFVHELQNFLADKYECRYEGTRRV